MKIIFDLIKRKANLNFQNQNGETPKSEGTTTEEPAKEAKEAKETKDSKEAKEAKEVKEEEHNNVPKDDMDID